MSDEATAASSAGPVNQSRAAAAERERIQARELALQINSIIGKFLAYASWVYLIASLLLRYKVISPPRHMDAYAIAFHTICILVLLFQKYDILPLAYETPREYAGWADWLLDSSHWLLHGSNLASRLIIYFDMASLVLAALKAWRSPPVDIPIIYPEIFVSHDVMSTVTRLEPDFLIHYKVEVDQLTGKKWPEVQMCREKSDEGSLCADYAERVMKNAYLSASLNNQLNEGDDYDITYGAVKCLYDASGSHGGLSPKMPEARDSSINYVQSTKTKVHCWLHKRTWRDAMPGDGSEYLP